MKARVIFPLLVTLSISALSASLPPPHELQTFQGTAFALKSRPFHYTLSDCGKGYQFVIDSSFLTARSEEGELFKRIKLQADYVSTQNLIGSGGFGLSYFFAPWISIRTGPSWVRNSQMDKEYKWSLQCEIELPFFP